MDDDLSLHLKVGQVKDKRLSGFYSLVMLRNERSPLWLTLGGDLKIQARQQKPPWGLGADN